LLATGEVVALGIALDATHAYWTVGRYIADGIPSGGKVMRVAFSGGAPETLASDLRLPTDIAVDAHNVYWIDDFSNEVLSVPSSGGDPISVARTHEVSALTIDATSAYWLDVDGAKRTSTVKKAPLAGGAAIELASAQLYTGGLAVDSTSVYWIDLDQPLGTVRVMKVPLEGGPATTLLSMASYSPNEAGTLAVDETSAYFVGGADGVLKIPLAGGTPTLLTSGSSGALVPSVAIDATNVYWADLAPEGGSVRVMKVPRNGGTETSVATNLPVSTRIVAHGSKICWITNDATSAVWCIDSCN